MSLRCHFGWHRWSAWGWDDDEGYFRFCLGCGNRQWRGVFGGIDVTTEIR